MSNSHSEQATIGCMGLVMAFGAMLFARAFRLMSWHNVFSIITVLFAAAFCIAPAYVILKRQWDTRKSFGSIMPGLGVSLIICLVVISLFNWLNPRDVPPETKWGFFLYSASIMLGAVGGVNLSIAIINRLLASMTRKGATDINKGAGDPFS